MSETPTLESDFVRKLTAVVKENIANEQFGVSELADKMHMSRSNLLRKVKKETNLSVSQLISQIRLKRGMELLRTSKLNVSEVSHQIGFSGTSYFIKCFREYYGYPPGEVGKRDGQKSEPIPSNLPIHSNSNRKRNFIILGSVCLIVALVVVLFFYRKPTSQPPQVEKSIAVLPFKNDSNDSSNLYLINGLMESTLINLQQIKDLRVLSRTSTEKYRNAARSIPEMANELNVVYFIEGSGQKIGDQIVLNIQLIDGPNDKHLWAKQYRRETIDIFALQREIAKDIAEEIQIIITPAEAAQLEKIPTENMEAYDYYLKGREYLNYRINLELAVEFFNKAIELDNQFAEAYADAAIAYYYIDIFKADKKYTTEIGSYSDKALLYDPKNAECLMAKAVYYMQRKEHELAIPYLERGLEYNPNSSEIIAILASLYGTYVPNTTKHLEYALKGLQLNISSTDSITTSYTYLQLSNALAQSGFTDEALEYIDKSLAYFPDNPYSRHLKAFILYAKNGDLNRTRELLIKEFNKDTTRFDILQDIGKVSYYLRDYEGAYQYYKKFVAIREHGKLDVYVHENLTIGDVYLRTGHKEKADEFAESYKRYVDNEKSIYKSFGLAMYYAYRHDAKKVVEYLKLAAKEDNYMYWLVLFCDDDPLLESLIDIPEVKKASQDIKARFWDNHNKIKETLEEKGLLVEK
jgi:TolB-like protein/AraC-like DNA-binding protein/Tfp pilus assembly protein PilF